MKRFIFVVMAVVLAFVSPAFAGELQHWLAIAYDALPCGDRSASNLFTYRDTLQNPVGQTIYIRKMDFYAHNEGGEAGINTYRAPWSRTSTMPFHWTWNATNSRPDRLVSFDPHYITMQPGEALSMEWWCRGGTGVGDFYLTIYYSLQP